MKYNEDDNKSEVVRNRKFEFVWRIDNMPHVEIKCFSGRTDEQKTLCAEKIAEVIVDTLGCKASSVSVAIKDVPENQWKEKGWDAHIIPDEPYLYKKPGYTCE